MCMFTSKTHEWAENTDQTAIIIAATSSFAPLLLCFLAMPISLRYDFCFCSLLSFPRTELVEIATRSTQWREGFVTIRSWNFRSQRFQVHITKKISAVAMRSHRFKEYLFRFPVISSEHFWSITNLINRRLTYLHFDEELVWMACRKRHLLLFKYLSLKLRTF